MIKIYVKDLIEKHIDLLNHKQKDNFEQFINKFEISWK